MSAGAEVLALRAPARARLRLLWGRLAVMVQPTKHFSALAGAMALAVIMLPIVARTVEEMLRRVPAALREAALALGAPRWNAFLLVTLPAARAGIVTGALVALARAAGEAAPLFDDWHW